MCSHCVTGQRSGRHTGTWDGTGLLWAISVHSDFVLQADGPKRDAGKSGVTGLMGNSASGAGALMALS